MGERSQENSASAVMMWEWVQSGGTAGTAVQGFPLDHPSPQNHRASG